MLFAPAAIFCLYIKTVIRIIAIQAKLLITCKPDPVGAGDFSAAVANIRIEQPCLFGQPDRSFLDIKHLFRLTSLVVGERLCFCHTFGSGFQHQTDGSTGLTVIERKCLLATHMEQKVSLADAATKHYLDTIHTASIIFRNALLGRMPF